MKEQIKNLFEYEMWANARILDALSQLYEPNQRTVHTMPDEKALDLMAHILLVEMVWYSRMEGKASPPVWAKKSLNECREVYAVNNKTLAAFIAQQTDDTLERVVDYKNTKGEKYSNTVTEILTHLFNHSTYHRGQIVERLKGKISVMPETDYIIFARGK